jgi:adenine deaminase
LSFDDALSALTIDAARALDIDQITGSIANGKAANLIVTTDTLFKEKTQISKVFIEGELFEQKVKEKKKSGDSDVEVDFSGTYSYSIDIPGMSPQGKMTFVKSGDTYEITINSNQAPGETFDATDVEVNGNNATFDFTINNGGFSISVSNDITLEDDSLEGTVTIPDFGSFELTGEKIDSPE